MKKKYTHNKAMFIRLLQKPKKYVSISTVRE